MSAAANVIEFVSEARVEEAFEALRKHRSRLLNEPHLFLDRAWIEQDGRLHSRFLKLFMASEPPCPVIQLDDQR